MKRTTGILTKIICMMLAALLCLGMFACNKEPAPGTTTPAATTAPQDPGDNPNDPGNNPNNPTPPTYTAVEQIADKFVSLYARAMALSSPEAPELDDEAKAELKDTFLEEFVPIYSKNIVTEQELISYLDESAELVTGLEAMMNSYKETGVEPAVEDLLDLVVDYYTAASDIFTMQRFGEIVYDSLFVYFDMMKEMMASEPDRLREEIAELQTAIAAGEVLDQYLEWYEWELENGYVTEEELLERMEIDLEWDLEYLPELETMTEARVEMIEVLSAKVRETIKKETFADLTNILYFTLQICVTNAEDVLDWAELATGEAPMVSVLNFEEAIALFQSEFDYIAETATEKITDAEWQSFIELGFFFADYYIGAMSGDDGITLEDMISAQVPGFIGSMILSYDLDDTANALVLLIPAAIEAANEIVQSLPVDDLLALLECESEDEMMMAAAELMTALLEDNKDVLVAFLAEVEACLAMADEDAQYQAIEDAGLLEAFNEFATMMIEDVTASDVIDAILAGDLDDEALGQWIVSYGYNCAPYTMFVVFYASTQQSPDDAPDMSMPE